jgi:hypothetical protein
MVRIWKKTHEFSEAWWSVGTMMDGRRRRRREKEKIRGTEEAVKILFLSYSIPPSPPPL